MGLHQKRGKTLCLQEGREQAPTSAMAAGGRASGARSRGWQSCHRLQEEGECKGSVTTELLLTVRGSSFH